MLCIVSVYRPDLYEEAVHSMATMGLLCEVIVDRRHGERRQPGRAAASPAPDRRQRHIDDELLTEGFAIVR